MSFKERLFGPPWESKDAEARARGVAASKDPRLSDKLAEIAAADPEPGVRIAALKRMDDERAWLKAREMDTDSQIRTAADHFIVRAVCEQPADDLLPARLAWLEAMNTPDALRRLAARASDAQLRSAALARINAQGFLGDCLVSEPDDSLAESVLARLEQVSTLKRIADQLRKKHKARHQAVMRRLAELESKSSSDSHDARDELALRLIGQAEKLARGEFSGDRKVEAGELAERWQALIDPKPNLARRFEGAMRIVRRALQPRPVREAPPTEVEAPAEDPELGKMVEQAQTMAGQSAGDKTADALNRLMSAFDRHWNTLRRPGPADTAARDLFQALCGELQARLQAQHKVDPQATVSTQTATPPTDEADAELQIALDQADQALAAGDIAQSFSAIRTARDLHHKQPGRKGSHDIGGRIARMSGQLKEMRDWQHWSNNKLRERLIERVGEIDAENLHPDAVTERLKELRQRWKELDEQEVLPGDKRRFAAPQSQWRRFQRACKQAFDAARPYLEKRSEVREESQRDLEDFLDQADKIVQAEQADTNELLRYQRAAREAIRNLDAVPPKSRGQMASRLRGLMDALSSRLEACFEAVAERKRWLIAEARKLAHEKERATAIDQAKRLQAEWKKAGRTRRKLDEQLWREFREPIDPLFEGMKKEREQQRAADHEHRRDLEQLCHEAEELAARKSQALADAGGPMAGLEERFAQASSIPPALRKRFDKAVATFRARVSEFRHEQRRRGDERLFSLARLLQQRWNDLTLGRTPEPTEMDSLPDDERAGNLAERLQRLASPDQVEAMRAEVADNTARARQVVIEMECLSGLDSPEEDRRQRMDFQVSRLSSRMGEGARRPDLATERAQLQQRWLESFPQDPESHDALDKRFRKADKILDGMNVT